jgi:hypothetical protein
MRLFKKTVPVILLLIISTACTGGSGSGSEEIEVETDSAAEVEETAGMLQHNVYFYLNEDVSQEQKEQFEEGLRELLEIETIYKSELGIPGSTEDRDVTDHSFGYSIFTWFETMEDYNVYADHPDHLEFIDTYSELWSDVKVYDSEIIE